MRHLTCAGTTPAREGGERDKRERRIRRGSASGTCDAASASGACDAASASSTCDAASASDACRRRKRRAWTNRPGAQKRTGRPYGSRLLPQLERARPGRPLGRLGRAPSRSGRSSRAWRALRMLGCFGGASGFGGILLVGRQGRAGPGGEVITRDRFIGCAVSGSDVRRFLATAPTCSIFRSTRLRVGNIRKCLKF